MLDIKYIRDNKELIEFNCHNRNVDIDIEELLRLDEERRNLLKEIEDLRAMRNQGSKGKPEPEEVEKMREVGRKIKYLEVDRGENWEKYERLLMQVPNLTHPDAPVGKEENFRIVETCGMIPRFSFEPKDHEILLSDLDLIDFERGAKVAGSKFYFAKSDLVRLNHALMSYGIDIVGKYDYTLMETPDMAKNQIMSGTGYNPRGDEQQIYSIENSDMSMIATAEITVGGYHMDEVLDLSKGPKKYSALSHCFRMEAGAYGKTSKGLYRVHQFAKLEMFIYCKPEESDVMHEELLSIEKEICDGLGLAYRVIDIASGDLGGSAYRKYDLEAWMTMKGYPSIEGQDKQGGYGEITSTSNCTDYQARRLNIKHKRDDGKTEYVHTLNGTAVVLTRFPIAIIEQNQQEDGSIAVPNVLQKYMGKEVIQKM